MKRIVLAGLVVLMTLVSCADNRGDRVLMVELVASDSKETSGLELTKEALQYGGYLSINVNLMREVDTDFDAENTVSDKDGKFLVNPALLNSVGSHGWKLVSVNSLGNSVYYFTKRYEKKRS